MFGSSGEWIANIQEVELEEITIMRVKRLDAMLPQQRRKVCIRNKVAARCYSCGDFAIDVPESFLFGKTSDVRQTDQRLDIGGGFGGRERSRKYRRVSGNS